MRTRLAPVAPAMSPPRANVRSQLVEIVRAAGVQLLATLGVTAQPAGSFDPTTAVWSDPVSFIGFGGRHVAGTLILSAPWPLMALTSPIDDHRPEAVADWSRELSNMALGAIKQSLLRRGLELQIGLPTSVVSSDLRVATTSRDPIGLRFGSGGHFFLLALDCVVAPSLELKAPRDTVRPASTDGFLFL